jgi:tetratricopeptide (TPR) repeat protein
MSREFPKKFFMSHEFPNAEANSLRTMLPVDTKQTTRQAAARGSVAIKRHHLRRLQIVFCSALGAFLAWQVVSQSFAAYFAEFAPETALWLQPRQPLALVNLADRTLNVPKSTSASATENDHRDISTSARKDPNGSINGKSGSDNTRTSGGDTAQAAVPSHGTAAKIRAWAVSALMQDPLNARALRILGQLADAEKNESEALKFMQAAAQVSLHDSLAIYWLMLNAGKARNYRAAIDYADALLRTQPELGDYIMPLLAHMAEDKESNRLLEAVLESNPPWRSHFFAVLPTNVTDARAPLDLLFRLRTSSTPPTSAEIARYVEFLIGLKLYELAYYTWLQFLPADELHNADFLFNGRFSIKPSGLPFDWVMTPGSGVTIDIVPKPESNDEHALLIDFTFGRADYHSVKQLVMLAPGTYKFEGQYRGELVGPRGLKWRIACAGEQSTDVGESPMIIGRTPQWKPVAFSFTIPAGECRAQYVRLDLDARMASETFVSGSVLFADVRISRAGNPH